MATYHHLFRGQEREVQRLLQSWFKTTCIVSFLNNISAGHTSLLQVYRCYWTYVAISILYRWRTFSIYIILWLLHKFSNICKPEEGWYGQPKYCLTKKKTIHVVLNQLCSSLWTSLSRLYILADLISFLEIQRLQLAGSSSTVFAVNLIPSRGVVLKETASRPGVPYTLFQRNPIDGSLGVTKKTKFHTSVLSQKFCLGDFCLSLPKTKLFLSAK